MASGDNEVRMMMSVVPGAMTGFAALHSGLVSINNVFGSMTRSVDAQFGLVNTAIMTTGVVVAQLGMDAMDAFGQFEQGMKIVQMVSGQTAQDIDYLSQKANQFSVQYRVDIDQITEGLQTLGRAGLNSASEQAEVLENGLYTAKLEGRDLNGVLEELIQTTALLGGDLKTSNFGEQTAYVEDLMVATSMSAPITTHDVNETLKYSGGIAAAAGANIDSEEGKRILEDYMGAIAAFAQKGVTGSIAGTALRAFFNKPATQDSSVTDALGSIGLTPESLWEEDEQTMRPVSEQIGIIQDQMDNLHVSTMDRLQIWSKIVGGKMGQQMMKLDSDDIKELTSDIRSADSASSLAAGSMRTYEANLKAVGESGALLQRNVGEKLVFFANPLLEIINKVLSFANQDVMSWPLTIGIIGFIGLAGTKAMNVLRALKAELSTLVSGLQKGLSFFTQKGGVVRVGDNPIEKEKNWAAYFKAKDEYYGRTSPGGKGGTPTTLKGFDKAFQKTITESGALSVAALQKAGLTNEQIGLAGRLSALTKQTSLGVGEGQVWATALKHNLVPEEQLNKMLVAYKSGANARPIADIFDVEKIIPKIMEFEQAMNDLGVKIQVEAEKIQSVNAAMTSTFGGKTNQGGNWQQTFSTHAEREALKQAAASAQAHAAAVSEDAAVTASTTEEVKAKEAELAATTKARANEVVTTFNDMWMAISAEAKAARAAGGFTKLPNRMYRDRRTLISGLESYFLPGYFKQAHLLYGDPYGNGRNISHTDFGNIPSPYNTLSPLKQEWMRSGLGKAFGYNLSDDKMAHYLAANRIPGYVNYSERAQEIARNNIKTYPDIGRGIVMPVYGPANDAGIQRWKDIQKQAAVGVGSGAGNVPGAEQVVKGISEEKARKAALVQQARDEYKAQDAASTKALKEHQENVRKNKLSTVQYGEEELINAQKRLEIEREILMLDIERQERLGVASAGMHGKGVAQTEAERFREEAKQQVKTATLQRNVLGTSSSDQVIPKNFAKGYVNDVASEAKAQAERARRTIEENSFSTRLNKQVQDIANRNQVLHPENFLRQKVSDIIKSEAPTDIYRRYNLPGGVVPLGPFTPINPSDVKISEETAKQSGGFFKNLSDRMNRDRTGSFLSFGTTTVNGVTRSATKGLSGLANKALNLTDAFGGPLMIAIMAVTTAIQLWQKAFQDYCERLKKAGDELNEAYDKWSSAEGSLEETFKKQNPDASDEEIDQMIYETYATMEEDMANAVNNGAQEWFKKLNYETETGPKYEYDEEKDDGSLKKAEEEELSQEEEYTKAIQENTGALYTATAELNKSLDNYTRQATDSWWGVDGWTGKLTDNWTKVVAAGFGPLGIAMESGIREVYGEKFTDTGEFILTQSQKDENYAGYTGMAGLMLEDFKDSKGNWIAGLRTMMGDDVEDLASTFGPNTSTFRYLKDMANFSAGIGQGGLTAQKNAKLQASMKTDQKTWKSLAKELAKRDSAKKAGKNIEKQEQKINGLVKKINSTLGNGFSKTQILQAAYLQQLQDMYQIAEQAIVPIMQTNMQTAMSTLSVVGQVDTNTGNTVSTTDGTQQNAAIIASLVSIIARSKAKEVYFDTVVGGSTTPGHITDVTGDGVGDDTDVYWIKKAQEEGMDANKFYVEYTKAYDEAAQSRKNLGRYGGLNPVWEWGSQGLYKDNDKIQEGALGYLRLYHATAKMEGYDYSPEAAAKAAQDYALDIRDRGVSLTDALRTSEKNYQSDSFKQKIIDAYNMAGEEDEGSGSGNGSGSGDSDKDKNSGTRKERVDLVLCNKKEIPKLNVNLFKKPPTFTVLNKNFKLRDVKINTEDKPKAIMASIKNAFIDVQKRSDPKIIQDEEAEYDPVAATDGNSVPSGSSRTGTNQ